MNNILKDLSDGQCELLEDMSKLNLIGVVTEYDPEKGTAGAIRATVGDIKTDWLNILMIGSTDYFMQFDIRAGSEVFITHLEHGCAMPITNTKNKTGFRLALGAKDEITHQQDQLKIKTKLIETDEHALLVGGREVQAALEEHDKRLNDIEREHGKTRSAVKDGFKLIAKKDPRFSDLEIMAGLL